jgi:carbon-monoxide dehydrogenase medium subunit
MIEYCRPATVEGALELLSSHPGSARIIAGGTDLLVDLRKGKVQAQILVDITRIPELGQIRIEGGFAEVGAAVTFATIQEHAYFKRCIPMLSEAASSVGAPGIRSAATWVGNLVQAMPAADGAIVALALEAEARVVAAGRAVWRPVDTLFAGPGQTAIDPCTQMITHLRFRIPEAAWGTAWQRIGRRSALTLPVINCAVKVELEDERIRRAVIALGPVATKPFRASGCEAYLAGQLPSQEIFAEAGRLAQGEADPRSNPLRASREYRLAIIPVLVRRALDVACQRAKSNHL